MFIHRLHRFSQIYEGEVYDGEEEDFMIQEEEIRKEEEKKMIEVEEKKTKPEEQRDEQTYSIIGAAMEVHRVLGHGFLEAVYQDALAVEFTIRRIPFVREQTIPIEYKGMILSSSYRADFICFDSVIIELKALPAIGAVEQAQVLNYLRATGLKRALLLNFGAPSLQQKRLVF